MNKAFENDIQGNLEKVSATQRILAWAGPILKPVFFAAQPEPCTRGPDLFCLFER